MSGFIATLVGGFDPAAAKRAVAARTGVTAETWLSPNYALDLTLGHAPDGLLEVLRAACPKADIALQPAENRRKSLLLADMDSTIVVGETIDEMAAHIGVGEKVAEITARAMRGELDFQDALRERVGLIKGLDAEVLAEIGANLTISPGAASLIATMRKAGAHCVLVSGGFDAVTSVVREKLGFNEDIANHLNVGPDGKLDGTARPPIIDATVKREVLESRAERLGVPLSAAIAVGDGANDMKMIDGAGLGVAYRAKPALKAATPFHIDHTDLKTILYFQGFSDAEIITP